MAVIMASGGQHGLQYVMETEFGVTPATPTMKTLRHTGCSLVLTKATLESAELRSDRQICDVRGGAKQVGGDINYELSYGDFDDLLAMALFNNWDTVANSLKAGILPLSATIERQFTDIGQYGLFRGCMVNSWNLSVSPEAMVTGTFGIVGLDGSYSASSIGGTLPSPVCGINPPFDGFTGGLKEGGVDVAIVTSIDLTLDNGLTPFFAVGSNSAVAIPSGRCNITGTLSAAFIDAVMLNKFINETESSLEFTLGTPSGYEYKVLLPRIKYTAANNPVDSESPIILEMPFQALKDNTEASNIVIERIEP